MKFSMIFFNSLMYLLKNNRYIYSKVINILVVYFAYEPYNYSNYEQKNNMLQI